MGLLKAALPGTHGGTDPVDVLVDFGPNAGAGLGANEFLIGADDGVFDFEFRGTFTVDAKGQPQLTVNPLALAGPLQALMTHICKDVLQLGSSCDAILSDSVLIDGTKLALPARTKAGKTSGGSLALSAKLPFELSDSTQVSKIVVTLKVSPPAALVP